LPRRNPATMAGSHVWFNCCAADSPFSPRCIER
jgi:hypothetical protein